MSAFYRFVISISLVAGSGCVAMDDTPNEAQNEAQDDAPDDAPAIAQTTQSLVLEERVLGCIVDPRVIAGAVSVDICAGADLFLRETFDGNGRSCATCHRVD